MTNLPVDTRPVEVLATSATSIHTIKYKCVSNIHYDKMH